MNKWPTAGRADGRDLARLRRAPEKAVDAACVTYLRMRGYHVSRLQQARASKQALGLPDLFAMKPGHGGFFVELKAPGGRLSRLQEAWHLCARAAGVRVLVVTSAADLAAALEAP